MMTSAWSRVPTAQSRGNSHSARILAKARTFESRARRTARKLTLTALELGYRNFFSSVLAQNQRGFAKAVKESGVPRDELFICGSVLSNRVQGEAAAYKLSKRGCEENMQAFSIGGIEYIDSAARPALPQHAFALSFVVQLALQPKSLC
jgi:diketogulonate reductase-like aldo/keto reductase